MGKGKFGTFVILGALAGAAISLFDRSTREQVTKKSKNIISEISYYRNNPDDLKQMVMEKKDKVQMVYNQLSGDANYLKTQVEELKTLTPQVKELVVDTKEAFVESKDEYKSIVKDEGETTTKPSVKK
ncbi:YtxH domain-containing protein [Sporosarcina sp. 179-K 3D1 HS]|uniref:YtxH domain-containing protein n=1 Tax=Sporosarcina sp. 179-K 3D1 HS TaxID=3232169 RepID=UPI0039A1A09D